MKLTIGGVLGEAWAMFRRDRDLLLALTGLLVFLPQFALQLLVPHPPAIPANLGDERIAAEFVERASDWGGRYGLWILAALALSVLAVLGVTALYLRGRPTLGEALAVAVRLWPRALLVTLVLLLPVRFGLLLVLPGVYLIARTMLALPAIVAEPVGAIAAIRSSFARTRGNGLVLTALAAIDVLGAELVARPFLIAEVSLADNARNPVVVAMLDGAASLAAAAGMLAAALIQVAVYRRAVASSGI